MSWLDFFKNRGEENKEPEIDRISLEELQKRLEKEKEEIGRSIQNIRNSIRQRILQLNSELSERINELRGIPLEERREQERLKFIVGENLSFYISNLQNLMKSLESLDFNDKGYFARIQSSFGYFIRASANNFEKATILIGKELADTRNSIKNFSEDVNRAINESSKTLEKQEKVNRIINLIAHLKQKKTTESQITASLDNLTKVISETEKKKTTEQNNLDILKNSAEYAKNLEEKEKRRQEAERLRREIALLKQEIDLKSLSKQFHHDEKKRKIIDNYSENFEEVLENDVNLKIADIIKEIKPDFDLGRIGLLRLRNHEIKKEGETEIEKNLRNIEEQIKRLDLQISDIKEEMEQEKKKKEKVVTRINSALNEISDKAKIFLGNVEISIGGIGTLGSD